MANNTKFCCETKLLVEAFFAEIESGGIPEKMCQNMLLSKETTSTNERHDCLFFRLSNLMAFFRKTPRFFSFNVGINHSNRLHVVRTVENSRSISL